MSESKTKCLFFLGTEIGGSLLLTATRDYEMKKKSYVKQKKKILCNQLDCARNKNHVEDLHLLHGIVERSKEQNKGIKINKNFIDFISEI